MNRKVRKGFVCMDAKTLVKNEDDDWRITTTGKTSKNKMLNQVQERRVVITSAIVGEAKSITRNSRRVVRIKAIKTLNGIMEKK